MEKNIHEILTDPQLRFVRKLQIAAASKLIYWKKRMDPPNLLIHEFKRTLPLIPLSIIPILAPRKSFAGTYGKTGEQQIFKFDFQVTFLRKHHQYFIKGYFFEEGNLHGVEIQTFRKKLYPTQGYNYEK